MNEGEDSTWKIVYMDMITMLMILFLSLWIVDRGKKADQRKHGDVTLSKVEFQADDYFDPGKARIKDAARLKLDELFSNPQNAFPAPGIDLVNEGRRIVMIDGHTDDEGQKEDNLELGFERAMAVYRELSHKVPALADNVGICSFADNFPVDPVQKVSSDMPASVRARLALENHRRRKRNRRFEIVGRFEELDNSFSPGD